MENGMLRLLPRSATAAENRISNQKNGIGGACVHHWAIKEELLVCPVKALARRVIHIRSNSRNGTTLLNAYWDVIGRGNVTNNNISFAMKYSAAALNCPARCIPIETIDTHFNRSGGACALKLAGYDDSAIRKMRRWAPNSSAFMEYIQQQLSSFSVEMSARMSDIPLFTNMEGRTIREDLRPSTIF